MGLRPPVPGLRVLHDTHTSEKVEISVPAGAEMIVPPYVAEQLVRQRSSFKVDPAELAEGLAAEQSAAETNEAKPVEEIPPAPASAAETVTQAKPRARRTPKSA